MIALKNNASLLKFNTFGFDVKASVLVEYDHEDDLPVIFKDPRVVGKKVLHLGSGSNILFTQDFDGVVLHSRIKGIKVVSQNDDACLVECGAGVIWDDFCLWCVSHGLHGVENLSAIPGEVGAAAVQNIGAYGAEFKDVAVAIAVYDTKEERHAIISAVDCNYGYRTCLFKQDEYRGRFVVTSVLLMLKRKPSFNIEYGNIKAALLERGFSLSQLNEKRSNKRSADSSKTITLHAMRETITNIRQAKLPDPKHFGNAGSFFKNPVITRLKYSALSSQWPDMPMYEVDASHVKVPAGWLIEHAGCKGRRMGDASVYERQCLVLINNGKAVPSDVVRLSEAIIRAVQERFDITIEPEVNII